jgi:hypothetical protein
MQYLSIEHLYISNIYQETQTIIVDWSIIYIQKHGELIQS